MLIPKFESFTNIINVFKIYSLQIKYNIRAITGMLTVCITKVYNFYYIFQMYSHFFFF